MKHGTLHVLFTTSTCLILFRRGGLKELLRYVYIYIYIYNFTIDAIYVQTFGGLSDAIHMLLVIWNNWYTWNNRLLLMKYNKNIYLHRKQETKKSMKNMSINRHCSAMHVTAALCIRLKQTVSFIFDCTYILSFLAYLCFSRLVMKSSYFKQGW